MDVVALLAHADDELMCAGTLARLVDRDHNVRLLIGCDERPSELDASAAAIGCKVERLGVLEYDFAWSKRWVEHIEPIVGRPDLLISHRPNDDNSSHGHLGRIARTIARKNTTSLWEIDQTWPGGLTDHRPPNLWVDISDQTRRKAAAVSAYPSQLQKYTGLGLALAQRDAANGWPLGVSAAEGFTVVKAVWL